MSVYYPKAKGRAVSTGSERSATCRCPANWTPYGLFLVQCYSDPNYGGAAILASATTALLLVVRQAPVVLLLAWTVGWSPSGLFNPRLFDALEHAPAASSAAVVAAWTVLALSGAGRRPSNWLERLGCVVGGTWVVLGILSLLVYYLQIPWLRTSGITW